MIKPNLNTVINSYNCTSNRFMLTMKLIYLFMTDVNSLSMANHYIPIYVVYIPIYVDDVRTQILIIIICILY